MNAPALAAALAGAVTGNAVGLLVLRLRLASAPRALLRTNVSGRAVPAVLGDAVVVGGLTALGGLAVAAAAGWNGAATGRTGAAAALLLGIMAAAGRLDDLRGEERVRGFGGHLRAAASGHLTGGGLKVLAGGIAGLVAGAMVVDGMDVVLVGLVIALAANLVNLLDRAPGRAAKAWLAAAVALAAAAPAPWTVAASGAAGALIATFPADLRERGMLGDAGSNPLGALAGLGLALATTTAGRVAAVVILLSLNLASERWSFSRAIEKRPWLNAIDRLGRK